MAKIYLASDHAGFGIKEALIPFLKERGHSVEDVGPLTFDENDDYPDHLLPMAARVAQTRDAFGIGIGGSGQGEAMVANRVKGARAAVYYGGRDEVLTKSREHNDANILSIGARFVSVDEAKRAVELWLATPFSGEERHVRRISKLGFTLVEILVAVSIVSILAAIVLINLNEGRKVARDVTRESDAKNIQLVLGLYGQDHNNYPCSDSGCAGSVINLNAASSIVNTALSSGGYMQTIPSDPSYTSTACNATDGGYCYCSTGGDSYVLTVNTENDGTGSDRCYIRVGPNASTLCNGHQSPGTWATQDCSARF